MSEWCVWLSGGVFLRPRPPQSSAAAAPLDNAVHETQYQTRDEDEAPGSWYKQGH